MADGSRARSSSTLEAEEDAADGESKLDEAAGDVHDGYGREEEEGGGKRRSFGRSKASGYTSLSRDNTDRSQRVTDEHDEASKPQPTVPLSADPALHSSLVPASVPASAVAGVAVSVSSVLIAGAGFMCDAYDLFIMNVLLVVMGCQYGLQPTGDNICKLTSSEESSLASAVVVGAIAGQLLFGVMADYLGRRRGFIVTLTLLIVGASLSAAAQSVGRLSLFVVLSLCRFVLGVGVGGEYPLSATVSSEASADSTGRGRRVSLVFSMQGVGLLAAPLVVLLLLFISGPGQYETVWRTSLALGAVPGVVMIYFRFRMKETAAFSAAQLSSDAARAEEQRSRAAAWTAHRWDLLATAGNWFIFDVVFYSNSLFSSQLTKNYVSKPLDVTDQQAVHAYLLGVAESALYLALCALPGYYGAVLVIDRWGRRKLQLFGYGGMCVMYVVCGVVLAAQSGSLAPAAFYLLYGLSFFFCNMGPNTTTFVIPSEIFPTSIRASAHGISAAAGKVGAAIGTAVMPAILSASASLPAVMFISAAVAAAGFLFTLALTRESQHTDIMQQQQQQQQQQRGSADDSGSGSSSSSADKPRAAAAQSGSSRSSLPSLSLSRAIRKARGYTDLLKQQSTLDEEEDEPAHIDMDGLDMDGDERDEDSGEEHRMDDSDEDESMSQEQQQQQQQRRQQGAAVQSATSSEGARRLQVDSRTADNRKSASKDVPEVELTPNV